MRFFTVTLLVSLLACSDPAVLDNRSGFGEKSQTKSGGDGGKSGNGNEGVEGFLQDLRYARNRCEFNEIDKETYDVICRAVIALPDGSEVAVTDAAPEIKVEFSQPKIKNGGVNIDSCQSKSFSQKCRISDVATIAEIVFIMKTRNKKTAQSRRQETAVVLPYSVQNILGNVMLHTADYQVSGNQKTGAGLKLDGEGRTAFGLQTDYVPNKHATVFGGDVCFNELGLFTATIGHVFVTRDGVSTKFAGSDFEFENELDHRLRLNFGGGPTFQPDIYCEEKSILVASEFRNKIYRLDAERDVDVVFDGGKLLPGGSKVERIARFKSGTFLIRSKQGKLYTWNEGANNPAKEIWDCDSTEFQGSKCIDGDFTLATDGSRIFFQDFMTVYEATESGVTKQFTFENYSDFLRFYVDGKFIFNRLGFLREYYKNLPEGKEQYAEWRPGLRLDDYVSVRRFWENIGETERSYIPIHSTFVKGGRFLISMKEGTFEIDGSTLKQIYGEGTEETNNPKWTEMDVVSGVVFRNEDEVYFQGANLNYGGDHYEALGTLDLRSKKVDYIHGSLRDIERNAIADDIIWWRFDEVSAEGAVYGRYVRRLNAEGEPDLFRKAIFKYANGTTTELVSDEYGGNSTLDLGRVSLDSSGAAVFPTLRDTDDGRLLEVNREGGDPQVVYAKEFGSNEATSFQTNYVPDIHAIHLKPNGNIIAGFKQDFVANDRSYRGRTIMEIPYDSSSQTYGVAEVLTGEGDVAITRENANRVYSEPVSWDDFAFNKIIYDIDIDNSGNIYALSDQLLFYLRASDRTVHIIFGNQTPQECATGLLNGETTEETFADSFRAGFSAFCPGDGIGGFDIRDECDTRGVYRLIVASGYQIGNFNVLLAERGCSD